MIKVNINNCQQKETLRLIVYMEVDHQHKVDRKGISVDLGASWEKDICVEDYD